MNLHLFVSASPFLSITQASIHYLCPHIPTEGHGCLKFKKKLKLKTHCIRTPLTRLVMWSLYSNGVRETANIFIITVWPPTEISQPWLDCLEQTSIAHLKMDRQEAGGLCQNIKPVWFQTTHGQDWSPEDNLGWLTKWCCSHKRGGKFQQLKWDAKWICFVVQWRGPLSWYFQLCKSSLPKHRNSGNYLLPTDFSTPDAFPCAPKSSSLLLFPSVIWNVITHHFRERQEPDT